MARESVGAVIAEDEANMAAMLEAYKDLGVELHSIK